jgi:hypothetical protein
VRIHEEKPHLDCQCGDADCPGRDRSFLISEVARYQVKSESGDKNLSSNDLTEEEAKKRLAEVEYFKKKTNGARAFAKK